MIRFMCLYYYDGGPSPNPLSSSHHWNEYAGAKQQLLNRLRRFEKLAELDPVELERKLLEESDDEDVSENEEPLSLYRKQSVETFVTQVFNQSSHPRNISNDMKRLVSDLIVEEKGDIICSGNNEVGVMGRIRNRLDSWKEVELNTIDMMIGLDFKKEFDGWTKFPKQLEETAGEIELAVYGLLVEELLEELLDYVLATNWSSYLTMDNIRNHCKRNQLNS